MLSFILDLLALLLLLVGAAMFSLKWLRARRFQHATGTVVGIGRQHTSGDDKDIVIVDFKLPSGETVRFTDPEDAGMSSSAKGKMVPVAYDPNQPQRAYINIFSRVYFTPLFLLAGGLVIIIIGLFIPH